jgi:hypothetical protein
MRSLLRGGDSSVSMSLSAESERLWLSHMSTQFAWACFAKGAMFGFHPMMPYTFLLALLERLSLTGATPLLACTIHKQSTSSSMLMHPVLLFCMRTACQTAKERLRATEKSAIIRWSQACRGAPSMHVSILSEIWPHLLDASFLLVASSTYQMMFPPAKIVCPG